MMQSEQCGTGKLPGNGNGEHDSERSAEGGGSGPITTQSQFEQAAEQEMLKINPTGEIIEIWRVRRQLGDRVSRDDFDERMGEMLAQGKVEFFGGALNVTPLQNPAVQAMIRDSIDSSLNGLRTYVRFPAERQRQLKAEVAKRLKKGEKLTKTITNTSGRTTEKNITEYDLK